MLDLFLLHYQKAVMSTQAVIEEEVGLVAIETVARSTNGCFPAVPLQ